MTILGHPLAVIIGAAVIIAMGATVQGTVGFGMGLVSIPLLLWGGLELPEAVALMVGTSLVQTSHGVWTVRRHVPWRTTLGVAAVTWALVPVGVAGMVVLAGAGPTIVKPTVGAIVAAILVLRIVVRPRPREHVGVGWGALAGAGSGLLAGLVGMGGPPVVLYALARQWTKDEFRGFLWSSFLLAAPVSAVTIAWHMGVEILVWTAIGTGLAPSVWLGSTLGFWLSRRWDADRLRIAATIMLAIVAAWSIVAPLLERGA